jgi:hypothetical protein
MRIVTVMGEWRKIGTAKTLRGSKETATAVRTTARFSDRAAIRPAKTVRGAGGRKRRDGEATVAGNIDRIGRRERMGAMEGATFSGGR